MFIRSESVNIVCVEANHTHFVLDLRDWLLFLVQSYAVAHIASLLC